MTPWRAATANPTEDMRANLALDLNRRFGTPLPLNQQHVATDDIGAAIAQDPAGFGANVAQGASMGGAGYFFPEVKHRADSFAGMYPTTGRLGHMAGGVAPMAALSPFVGVAGAAGLGGGLESYFDQPANAPLQDKLVNAGENALVSAVVGHYLGKATPGEGNLGSYFAKDMGDQLGTALAPTRAPVLAPALKGLSRLGAAAILAKLDVPGLPVIGPLLEHLPYAEELGLGGGLYQGYKGLRDLGTMGKNVLRNIGATINEARYPHIPEPLPTPPPPVFAGPPRPTPTTWTMVRGPRGQYTGRVMNPAPAAPAPPPPPPPLPPPGRSISLAFVPQGTVGYGATRLEKQAQPYLPDLARIIAEHDPGRTDVPYSYKPF
jgi:hypothetical protein